MTAGYGGACMRMSSSQKRRTELRAATSAAGPLGKASVIRYKRRRPSSCDRFYING